MFVSEDQLAADGLRFMQQQWRQVTAKPKKTGR
jgi:hypothetical protein